MCIINLINTLKHTPDNHRIVGQSFQDALHELRQYASKETKEMESPVMRFLQIEERLKRHLKSFMS
jgi:hypothetical protein